MEKKIIITIKGQEYIGIVMNCRQCSFRPFIRKYCSITNEYIEDYDSILESCPLEDAKEE